MKKKYPCQNLIPANIKAKKTIGQLVHLFFLIITAALPTRLMAQAPTIRYQTPNTYLVGAYAKPLNPVSSGVAAYGYNTTYTQLATGLSLPNDIVVDNADNVYIADTYNNRVVKIPKGTSTPCCYRIKLH